MDFTIQKEQLLSAIDKCAQATDAKHQTASFRMMRFEARKKKGLVSAVGEHMSIEAGVITHEVKEPGSFSVIPQRLRDIAAGMPDNGIIRITLKGTRVTVKSVGTARKATFENYTVDPFKIDDPGESVAWQEVKCSELLRVLKTAKYSCNSERVVGLPSMLLIPTEAGSQVFASNSYLITLADSSIRLDRSDPIQVPLAALDIIALMLEESENIRLFQSGTSRLYLENDSTLASVALSEYQLRGVYQRFIDLLHDPVNRPGPSFKLGRLIDSTKSVLSAGKFATGDEHGSRGYLLRMRFGDSVNVALALAEADAEDEFDVIKSGEEIKFGASSAFFLQLLGGLTGVDEVQAIAAQDDDLLVLRSKGIMAGIMRAGQKEAQ